MSGPAAAVAATTQAIDLIDKLKRRFGPLMFVQSGGCCDGSAPMCFPEGEFLLGPHDLLLGSIAGCSYYIDAELFARWGCPHLLIDCAAGGSDSLSLEGSLDMHFVARACGMVSSHLVRE